MTLVRANALGWAPFEEFTATQANIMDSQLPYAIDGAGGGAYDPTEDIELVGNNARGLKFMNGTVAWPLLETRELKIWQPLTAICRMSELNVASMVSGQDAWIYDGGFADWENANTAGRKGGLVQVYVDLTPSTMNVPHVTWAWDKWPNDAKVKGAGLHVYHPTAGGSIEQRPKVDAWRRSMAVDGAEVSLGAQAVAPANYRQTNTMLEVTFTPAALDGNQVLVQLLGEAGANVTGGLRVLGGFVRVNISELRP